MPREFVRTSGTQFVSDSAPVSLAGVNCYFLGFCSDSSRRAIMSVAQQIGANVIRCWGFLDVEDRVPGAPAFQFRDQSGLTSDDGPNGLERLDDLIYLAEAANIGLILPLVNYWPDFGGMPLYLRWLDLPSGIDEFYSSPLARRAYKNWVEHILTRRNTITGRLYSEEPAVIAWELANEPRCIEGGPALMVNWIAEMSRFLKSLDQNHLLAVGDEGFFYKRGKTHLYDGRYGTDFEAILQLQDIDFGTYHLYPQNWGQGARESFEESWITDHISAGDGARKPVLLEECGLRLDADVPSQGSRNAHYRRWSQLINDLKGAGLLLWMLGANEPDTAAFRDAYTFLTAAELDSLLLST